MSGHSVMESVTFGKNIVLCTSVQFISMLLVECTCICLHLTEPENSREDSNSREKLYRFSHYLLISY